MPDPQDIAAIVLAAGSSRRFGSDKLLHPLTLHGVTLPLAAHSLLPWLETFERTTVVIRPGSTEFCRAIEAALDNFKHKAIRWAVCADASQEMSASLACGINANPGTAGCLIGLADMPAVPLAAIVGVRNALSGGATLAAPFDDDRRGHPVGFASQYYEELLSLTGDTGARRVLEQNMSRIMRIQVDDEGIIADIDMPSDLQYLEAVSKQE